VNPPASKSNSLSCCWKIWQQRIASLGVLSKGLVLTGALTAAMLPVVVMALARIGWTGASAALAAYGTCLLAGIQGLLVAAVLQRRSSHQGALLELLAGMLVRMGVPLLVLIALVVKAHPLIDSGFGYYLIGFYQVMLFVEVMLIVPTENPPMMTRGRYAGGDFAESDHPSAITPERN